MRASLRDLLRRLLREHSEPGRLGAAVAAGIVVGCSPFFGFHLWIGLGLAWIFRLNKVAVIVGSHISIPPLAPLIGFASVQVGSRLLEGRWLRLAPSDFALGRLPGLLREFLLDWLVGGIVVGAALAIPAFAATFCIARRRRAAHGPAAPLDPWPGTVRRALALYAGARRSHREYLRFKSRMDPVYRLVCERLGRVGTVVDLGTGFAFLPVLLALRGQAEAVVGIEWDEAKLSSARVACSRLPCVNLHSGDARAFTLPPADAVCLVDLLHYYPVEEQRALLARAAAALRPGGRLVIRETRNRDGGGAIATRLLERLALGIGWNRGPGLAFRSAAELVSDLSALGLECSVEGASSSVHAGNMLLWARKSGYDDPMVTQ